MLTTFDPTTTVRDICALSVLFSVSDEFHASLSLTSHSDVALTLSIFHEKTDGTFACYDIAGDQDGIVGLVVSDTETLRLQVRRYAAVVSSAILEVSLALAETMPALLIPRLLSNIILDQCAVVTSQSSGELATTGSAVLR